MNFWRAAFRYLGRGSLKIWVLYRILLWLFFAGGVLGIFLLIGTSLLWFASILLVFSFLLSLVSMWIKAGTCLELAKTYPLELPAQPMKKLLRLQWDFLKSSCWGSLRSLRSESEEEEGAGKLSDAALGTMYWGPAEFIGSSYLLPMAIRIQSFDLAELTRELHSVRKKLGHFPLPQPIWHFRPLALTALGLFLSLGLLLFFEAFTWAFGVILLLSVNLLGTFLYNKVYALFLAVLQAESLWILLDESKTPEEKASSLQAIGMSTEQLGFGFRQATF